MQRLLIIGAGIAAIAMLTIGCGSGGEEEATAQISKAQFMKQANKLCSKTQKELQKLLFGSKPNSDRFEQVASLLEREAGELEALHGPEALETKVEPLVASISEAADLLAREEEKALENPRIAEYKGEAEDLNLREC